MFITSYMCIIDSFDSFLVLFLSLIHYCTQNSLQCQYWEGKKDSLKSAKNVNTGHDPILFQAPSWHVVNFINSVVLVTCLKISKCMIFLGQGPVFLGKNE